MANLTALLGPRPLCRTHLASATHAERFGRRGLALHRNGGAGSTAGGTAASAADASRDTSQAATDSPSLVQRCTPLDAVGRASLLRGLPAFALLLGASASRPAPAAASGAAAAEQAAAACRGCVAAVAAIGTGKSQVAAGLQQLGSGIVWGTQGYVITAYSPLSRVQQQSTNGNPQVFVTVTAADGSAHELPAIVIAKDPSHDLILLQVEPPSAGLVPARLGSSAGLRVGQDAILVGAMPTGNLSVTAGVLSATGRAIPASNNQAIAGVLQTDADVNAQTLGGALLDSSGLLVGMPVVTYASKRSARSSGVNFALPSDLLREVVPRLIVYKSSALRR